MALLRATQILKKESFSSMSMFYNYYYYHHYHYHHILSCYGYYYSY